MPRLVVPSRRTAPLGPAAFKAAAGALEVCAVATVSSIADAVRTLGGFAVWTVGLDRAGERSLFGLELLGEPVAVVVGGETGLHRLVRERVDGDWPTAPRDIAISLADLDREACPCGITPHNRSTRIGARRRFETGT